MDSNSKTTPEALAAKIVERLFTNDAGEQAERLVLELPGGKNGGGWARDPAADQVYLILTEALNV